jgi:hypothetical protein
MVQLSEVPVDETAVSLVTDDDQHIILNLVQADGAETAFAIPHSECMTIIDRSSKGLDQSMPLMTLTFDAGGKFWFQPWGGIASALLEMM